MTIGVLINTVFFLGMAAGRGAILFIERPGGWPLFFIVMETGLAGLLLGSMER